MFNHPHPQKQTTIIRKNREEYNETEVQAATQCWCPPSCQRDSIEMFYVLFVFARMPLKGVGQNACLKYKDSVAAEVQRNKRLHTDSTMRDILEIWESVDR